MFDFLDRLREQNPEKRMFIAVATSVTITALITIVWVVSFGVTLRKGNPASSFDASSLDVFKKQIDGTVEQGQRVLESLNNIQQSLSSTTASTTGSLMATSAATSIPSASGNLPQTPSTSSVPINAGTTTNGREIRL